MTTPVAQYRILIVDDESAHMQALCDILRSYGFDTTGLSSGDAAAVLLRTERFDLLLADLMMPGIGGIELVEGARKIDPDLACIIMTGEGTIASAVQAMKIGALDYIIKPFKASTLLPVLTRALETRQLRIDNAKLEQRLREHADELDTLNRDLQIAKQTAETANREKSAFLSNMSHELRTPLNAILGFAQILTADMLPSTPAEKKEYANDIYRAGTHLLTLINEILDLAKVESGTMSLSLEAVALADVFDSCQTMVEPLAKKRGIDIFFPEKIALNSYADRTRLKQVLINLLSNAIKYNHEGGTVIVDCEQSGRDRVRISVRDTGVGLNPVQLAEIFQPFNRLGREGGSEEGTGLGLALSKRLIEAMHGAIGVSSTAGVGSTFWLELTVTAAQDIKTDERIRRILPTAAAGTQPAALKTLLYVEDNPTNLKLVTELIRLRADLQLLTATDGYLGIELARRQMPHAILMDINLPGIDGIETLRILHSDPKTAHIPVIAITANAMPVDVRKGMAAGFFRYLTKPIDIETFSEAIGAALELSASRCNI